MNHHFSISRWPFLRYTQCEKWPRRIFQWAPDSLSFRWKAWHWKIAMLQWSSHLSSINKSWVSTWYCIYLYPISSFVIGSFIIIHWWCWGREIFAEHDHFIVTTVTTGFMTWESFEKKTINKSMDSQDAHWIFIRSLKDRGNGYTVINCYIMICYTLWSSFFDPHPRDPQSWW